MNLDRFFFKEKKKMFRKSVKERGKKAVDISGGVHYKVSEKPFC